MTETVEFPQNQRSGLTIESINNVCNYVNSHPEIVAVHTNSEIVKEILEKAHPNLIVYYYKPKPKEIWKNNFHWHFGNNHLMWMDEMTEKK